VVLKSKKKVKKTELIQALANAMEQLIHDYSTTYQHDLLMHECERLLAMAEKYR
jgi:hypothetical protein